jgi:hypothetical protein
VVLVSEGIEDRAGEWVMVKKRPAHGTLVRTAAAMLVAVSLMIASTTGAQSGGNLPPAGAYQPIPNYTGTGAGLLFRNAINDRFSGVVPTSPVIVNFAFANLPPEEDGALIYCDDCQQVNPCTSGGGGAWAFGAQKQWECTAPGRAASGANSDITSMTALNAASASGASPTIAGFRTCNNGTLDPACDLNLLCTGSSAPYGFCTGAKAGTFTPAKCDGSTNDLAAIQATFAAAIVSHAPIQFPAGTCLMQINGDVSALNLTASTANTGTQLGGNVYGASRGQGGTHPLTDLMIEQTGTTDTGVGIDMVGAAYWHWHDMTISGGTSSANAPQILVLLGKTCLAGTSPTCTSSVNGNQNTFDHIYIEQNGSYGMVIIGAEDIKVNQSYITGQSANLVISIGNTLGLTSPDVALNWGANITEGENSFNQVGFTANGAESILFDDGDYPIMSQRFHDDYFDLNGSTSAGIADTGSGSAVGSLNHISIEGMHVETVGSGNNVFAKLASPYLQDLRFTGDVDGSVSSFINSIYPIRNSFVSINWGAPGFPPQQLMANMTGGNPAVFMNSVFFSNETLSQMFGSLLTSPGLFQSSGAVYANDGVRLYGASVDNATAAYLPVRATIGTATTAGQESFDIYTLSASLTLTLPTATYDGQIKHVKLCENATGGYTPTWAGSIKWSGGSAPAPTTAANKCDIYGFAWDATAAAWNETGFVANE